MPDKKPLVVTHALQEAATELKRWVESAEGRRELATMMEKVRRAEADAATARRLDPEDLHKPFTL